MGKAWQVWLHPRRAVLREAELEETVRSLESKLEEDGKRLQEIRQGLAAAGTALTDIKAELRNTREELEIERNCAADLRDELEKERQRVADMEILQAAMGEFEVKLQEFENIKRQYEMRIERLRAKIIQLKNERTEPSDLRADAPGATARSIDMTGSLPEPVSPTDPDADWLLTLD